MHPKRTIPQPRLDEVEKRYLQGQSCHQIEKDLSIEYQITRRQVRNYLAIVKNKLAARFVEIDPAVERARVESLLLRAYQAAEVGSEKFGSDARAMVLAAGRLGDLYGVFAPQQINHNVNAAVVVLPELETSTVATESGTTDKVSRE